jgi:hypothetical protein
MLHGGRDVQSCRAQAATVRTISSRGDDAPPSPDPLTLARQRNPDPPATIMTPAALTLHHAPIADCARYDNLRRPI